MMESKHKNKKKNKNKNISTKENVVVGVEAKCVTVVAQSHINSSFDVKNVEIILKVESVLMNTYLKENLKEKALELGNVVDILIFGNVTKFKITDMQPMEPISQTSTHSLPFFISNKTKLIITKTSPILSEEDIQSQNSSFKLEELSKDTKIEIGGLKTQIQTLSDILDLSFSTKLPSSIQFPKPKGILITGPSGVGKTTLVKFIAQTYKFPFINIPSSELSGPNKPKILEGLFVDAKKKGPCILFFDNIDKQCPASKGYQSNNKNEITNSLIEQLDKILPTDSIIIIGTSIERKSLSAELTRGGRIDYELRIDPPVLKERMELLEMFIRKINLQISEELLTQLARETNGFVPSDLISLVRNISIHSLSNYLKSQSLIDEESTQSSSEEQTQIQIQKSHIQEALFEIRPSQLKDIITEVPKVFWSQIGGNEEIKKRVQECVEWPLKYPEAFSRIGITPPQGILLYGPPGCSKTMVAKALATESNLNFIAIKGPELFSKYVGDTEKALREIFRKARISSPCVLFFDEIDAMGIERSSEENSQVSDRILSQLLNEMDGISNNKELLIIAATNRPDLLDKALLRPGRFDRLIYVPLPKLDTRLKIFEINTKNMPLNPEISMQTLSLKTEGYSGAEISLICREAGMIALNENIKAETVKLSHFQKALEQVKPRIKGESLKLYEDFEQNTKMIE